jgi:hypothetical protein
MVSSCGWPYANHHAGKFQFRLRQDRVLLKRIAKCEVGHRPGRLEPRVLKRRRHGYPLMQKPRDVLKRELRKHTT